MTLPSTRRATRACLLALLCLATLTLPGATYTALSQPHLAALPSGPAPEALPVDASLGTCLPDPPPPGDWVFLSDLPWARAQTGWQAIADVVDPERDVSFSRNPLVAGGTSYAKGLGTYPLSEIDYALAGHYLQLHALLGLNDDSAPSTSAVFLVYADGALIFNSGAVGIGPPLPLDLCVAGVRTLRLVTALAGRQTPGAEQWTPDRAATFPDWLEARLFRPRSLDAPAIATAGAVRSVLDSWADTHRSALIAELGAYWQLATSERQAIDSALATESGLDGWPAETRALRDPDGRLVLANRRLALAFGFGGPQHGTLTAIDPSTGTPVLQQADSAIGFAGGTLDLAGATEPAGPDSYQLERIDDPVLGPGARVRATLRVRDAPGATIEVELALFDDRPAFTFQLTLAGTPPAAGTPLRFEYFDAGDPALVVGDQAHYFADATYVRSGELPDDGLWRTVRIGLGKPAVVWGAARTDPPGSPGGLVLAVLDEQRLPAWLTLRRDRGHAAVLAGISQPLLTPELSGGAAGVAAPGAGGRPVAGPRLLVELTATDDLRAALTDYRQIAGTLYPPAPLPDWVRYQWGSWWVYGSGVDEQKLRRQIDFIAQNLADLGPWHLLIDAGWQDAGPGASGDLGAESRARFPSGLRTLVDYAHQRGLHVILFYSAAYAHDGTDQGEWLGLPGLIGPHPDWFIQLTAPGGRAARYLFDYTNPGTRDYLASVLTRYLTEYHADGVKIDGLGDVEGQLIPLGERVRLLPRRWALTPVLDIYRFVAQTLWGIRPDAYIESGWIDPMPAQRFAHSFRDGDEWNVFDHGYPFPGLALHFRAASIQRVLLGQRANIGAVYGQVAGGDRAIAEQWLGAALATGSQVSLETDLPALDPDTLASLRAYLANLRPYAGTTRTGPEGYGLDPAWAATTTGDLTFVALVNHEHEPQRLEVTLADLGLGDPASGPTLAYAPGTGAAHRLRGSLVSEVPPETLQLFVLRQTPGVVWTTSDDEVQPLPDGWRLQVRGPEAVEGRLLFYLPGGAPARVLLDGRPLALEPATTDAGAAPAADAAFYDAATGVVTLHYAHRGAGTPRVLEIDR